MALKAVLTKLDGIDEAQKKFYVEKDGKFFLDVESSEGVSLENADALRKALAKERENVSNLKATLEKFGEADPDTVQAALKLVKDLDGKPLDKAVEERLKLTVDRIATEHKKELTKLQEENSSLMHDFQEELVVGTATRGLVNRGVENVDLLLPHVRRNLIVKKQEGKYVPIVVDSDGKTPRLGKSGSNLTIDEYIEEMSKSKTFAVAFPGSNGSGGGGVDPSGGGRSGNNNQFVIKESEASDPRKYRAIRAAAEKAGQIVEVVSG